MRFDVLLVDVRFAFRRLARTPVFTALDQTIIRPLPFRQPERLVMLWEDFSALGRPPKQRVSPATFLDWRARSRSFDAMGAYGLVSRTLTGGAAPREVNGARVTANLVPLVGVSPLLGRTF